jgi:hypothetical protein
MLIKDREGLDKPSSNSKEDKKVWMKAYISATQAPNSKFSSKQAALRADECLTLYKERFSK